MKKTLQVGLKGIHRLTVTGRIVRIRVEGRLVYWSFEVRDEIEMD